MKVDPQRAYTTLDGLRGVAAFAVVFCHTRPTFVAAQPFHSGPLSVDLFFALSGFVLSHAYVNRLGDGLSVMAFLKKRLIRLYPLYGLGGLLAFACLTWQVVSRKLGYGNELVYVANLFYLPAVSKIDTHIYPLNFPAWSLGLELAVNVLMALCIKPLRHPWVLAATVGVSASALVYTAFYYGGLDVGANWPNAAGGLARVLFSFFAGMAIYRLRKLRTLPLPSLTSYALAFLLLMLLLVDISGPQKIAYHLFLVLVAFPLLVYLASCCEPRGAGQTVMAVAGAASYAVYVLQAPVLYVFDIVMQTSGLQPSYLMAGAFIVSVLVAGFIADFVYDVPVRRYLTARFDKPRPIVPRAS